MNTKIVLDKLSSREEWLSGHFSLPDTKYSTSSFFSAQGRMDQGAAHDEETKFRICQTQNEPKVIKYNVTELKVRRKKDA